MNPDLPVPTHTPGFVVLDAELPDRPPLGHADDYEAAQYVLAAVQTEFYDQLDANGEGGYTAQLALALAAVDATGTVGPPFHFETINGKRPHDGQGALVKAVREVTTAELRVGDTVDWKGERREVQECRDTGQPAAFGSGNAYDVTLLRQDGTSIPMQAGASQRWLRV